MSKLSGVSFLSKWASLFADNSSRDIAEADLREFREDINDSFLNLSDQEYTGIRGLNSGINTIAGLKSVLTASLDTGVLVLFRDTDNGNILRAYELISDTAAESSPTIIRPNDFDSSGNPKVWSLLEIEASLIDGGSL